MKVGVRDCITPAKAAATLFLGFLVCWLWYALGASLVTIRHCLTKWIINFMVQLGYLFLINNPSHRCYGRN